MRTIGIILAAAIIGLPLVASADEYGTSAAVHHVRLHRHYYPRIHYGYYWYQWGWRKGGTPRSWYGSSFSWVQPYVWVQPYAW